MLYALLKPVVALAFRLFFRLRAVGVEHVPAEGAVLLAANHVSLLDPPAVGAAVARRLRFMAKVELFGIPVLGGALRRLGAHPVERAGSDAAALRVALSLLRAGDAILVFPEGTRGQEGILRAGRPGVGLLAGLSGAAVVPVYIRGTGRALPRGARWPRRTPVTVVCGAPLRFRKRRGKEHYRAISEEIMAAIGRLKEEVERGAEGGAARATSGAEPDRATRRPLPAGQIH